MKTKNLLTLCGSAIAAGIIADLMYTVRGLLPDIAFKVIIAILVIASMTALYIISLIAKRCHAALTDMRMKHLDHHERRQRLLMDTERHQMEMLALQADMHLKLSRVYADPNGNYPVLVPGQVQIQPSQLDYLMLPAGQMKGVRQPVQVSAEQEEKEQDETLPTSVTYEEIKHLIPPGQSLLGVGINGIVRTCAFAALMTMWICGGSSTGKTNTVSIKINEAIENGRDIRFIVIDPHKEKEDSLYNKIKRYESRFLFQVASTGDEVFNALSWFKQEFLRRLEAGNEAERDILLIVDEVPRVVKFDDETGKLLKEIAEICGTESRGFGMFGWFISQRAAGLSWLRNVVITVIAHKMNMMSERKLAANDDPKIARSMDSWPRGRVVVYGAEFEPTILQMPLFTPPTIIESTIDEMEPLQPMFPTSSIIDFQTQQRKRSGTTPETAQEKAGNDTDELSEENAATLKKVLLDIREKRASGIPLNTILREEYGIEKPGRINQEVKHLLDEMDAIAE